MEKVLEIKGFVGGVGEKRKNKEATTLGFEPTSKNPSSKVETPPTTPECFRKSLEFTKNRGRRREKADKMGDFCTFWKLGGVR